MAALKGSSLLLRLATPRRGKVARRAYLATVSGSSPSCPNLVEVQAALLMELANPAIGVVADHGASEFRCGVSVSFGLRQHLAQDFPDGAHLAAAQFRDFQSRGR